MKTKMMQKAGLGGMAILLGLGVGVTGITTMGQPVQEAHAMQAEFGMTKTMQTARAVYYDTKGKPGKKEAGYYKGTKYTVQGSYSQGYYKVKIHGISGYRWMHYTSVLGDK